MPDPSVHLIVFSKDRPLQLHGMLTSVFRHWRGDFRVTCLINPGADHSRAYVEVYKELMGALGDETERLVFEMETGLEPGAVFSASITRIVDGVDAPYVCFGCDDVVYTHEVDVARLHQNFEHYRDLLGFSLRLGLTHTKADMFGRDMPPPYTWDGYDSDQRFWDVGAARGDWGYPWEVLGTVYRTEFVRRMVSLLANAGQANNPSHLEHYGAQRWREQAEGLSRLGCGWSSRLVVPTVNLVQQEFGNGIVGPPGLDPAFLLDCWNRGLRLDVERYRGMAPPSWRIGDLFLKRAA